MLWMPSWGVQRTLLAFCTFALDGYNMAVCKMHVALLTHPFPPTEIQWAGTACCSKSVLPLATTEH